MLPKKTRRNNRSKKARLLFFGFLILFSIIAVFLIYSSFLVKKELFISPVVTTSNNSEKKLEKLLSDAQITFVTVAPLQDSYRVVLSDGGEVILSLRKNIEKQITSLQPILKQLTIDGRKFNRIDFRFDKPLVVYE